jgi:hypothetical protein
MGGVVDGQAVSAAVTNPAFIEKNANDTMPFILGLADTTSPSGAAVTNPQQYLNTLGTTTGATQTVAGTVYGAPTATINNGDSHQAAFTKIANKFHPTTGHIHDGTDGNGGPIAAPTITASPLAGFFIQGTDLTGVTGATTVVTTQMAGKTESSGSTVAGVVTTTVYNKVTIRNSANDDEYLDAFGNIVYGRITKSGSVWTLSYYSSIAGVETVYPTFSSAAVRWYYQELFKILSGLAPVYNPLAVIPSDTTTGDVLPATTTLQGKTLLSSSTSADIASAGTIGTTNATVANSDHTHKGIASFRRNGGTLLYGAVTVSASNGVTATQTSQDVAFAFDGYVPALTGTLTINDNAAATTLVQITDASIYNGINYEYSIKRGTNHRNGIARIVTDNSTVTLDDQFVEIGSCGVTLSADLSGSVIRLRYTSTSTGTAGKMTIEYKLKPIPV